MNENRLNYAAADSVSRLVDDTIIPKYMKGHVLKSDGAVFVWQGNLTHIFARKAAAFSESGDEFIRKNGTQRNVQKKPSFGRSS